MTLDEKRSKQIEEALHLLGIEAICVEYEPEDHYGERASIYVDGEHFGIYDFVRETFVD